jgi:hypothetical protein
VASVRAFILRHASRFQPTNLPDPETRLAPRDRSEPVRDRCGWVNRDDNHWLFTDAGLTEAAPGNDLRTVAQALRRQGYLFTNESAKLKARVTTSEGRPWLYAVKGAILDGGETGLPTETPGQPGQPGHPQQPQGPEPVPVPATLPGQPGQRTSTTAATGPEPVPVVPVAKANRDSPQDLQPQGVVPGVPVVPPIIGEAAFSPDGEAVEVNL